MYQHARACEHGSGSVNDKTSVFNCAWGVCVCISRSASRAQCVSECVLGSKCIPDCVCVYVHIPMLGTPTVVKKICQEPLLHTNVHGWWGQQVDAFRILTLKGPMRREEVWSLS